MNIISLSSNCTNHEHTFKLDYDLWVKLTFIQFQLTCIKRNFTMKTFFFRLQFTIKLSKLQFKLLQFHQWYKVCKTKF